MFRRLLAWLRGGGDGGRGGDWVGERRRADDDDGTVWDVMPDWSYGDGGRLHGGAIARDDQERAVEDVAEQAEQLSEPERH